MNCDNCGKPAFIQVKIVGPFGARDVNLCHDCYEEYMNNLKNETKFAVILNLHISPATFSRRP